MPRFFFDTHDGLDATRDEEGTECDDLAMARREAVSTAGEILREQADLWTGRPWTMIVRDDLDTVVAKLTFRAQ